MIKTESDLKELFKQHEKDNYCVESYKIILDYVLDGYDEADENSIDVEKLSKQFTEYNDISEAFKAYDGESYYDDYYARNSYIPYDYSYPSREYDEYDIKESMEGFFDGLDDLDWWEVKDDNPRFTVILIYDTDENRIALYE